VNVYKIQLILRATTVPPERVIEKLQTLHPDKIEFEDSVGCVHMTVKNTHLDLAYYVARAYAEKCGVTVVAVGPDDLSTVEVLADQFAQPVQEVARWVHNSRALRFPDVRAWSHGKPLWSRCEVAQWAVKHKLVDPNAHKVALEFRNLSRLLKRMVDQSDDDVNDFVQHFPLAFDED
jgi:hypothetical protein